MLPRQELRLGNCATTREILLRGVFLAPVKDSVYWDNLLANSALLLVFGSQDVFDIFHHVFAYAYTYSLSKT